MPKRILMEGNVCSRLEGTQHQMGQCRDTCQTQEKLDSTCCWNINKERKIQMSKALFNICNVTLLMTLMGSCRDTHWGSIDVGSTTQVEGAKMFPLPERGGPSSTESIKWLPLAAVPSQGTWEHWLCRSGATRRTEHLSYLTWLMTWGSTAIKRSQPLPSRRHCRSFKPSKGRVPIPSRHYIPGQHVHSLV